MTEVETSEYLSLSKEKFDKLMSSLESRRKNTSKGYDAYMFIPFVEINGQKYFNNQHVDNWIEYQSLNK